MPSNQVRDTLDFGPVTHKLIAFSQNSIFMASVLKTMASAILVFDCKSMRSTLPHLQYHCPLEITSIKCTKCSYQIKFTPFMYINSYYLGVDKYSLSPKSNINNCKTDFNFVYYHCMESFFVVEAEAEVMLDH